jgi:glucokinase
MERVLAVDLGGTKTATARVDAAGRVEDKIREAACPSLAETCERIAARASAAAAIGVIVPGIYAPATGMAWAPNLWGWNEVPLKRELESRLKVPVWIDSDRSGYVLGEQWLGVARGCRDVVFLAIGTGIGAGVLTGGRLVRGARGIAGAVGWMALAHEFKEEYRRLGCWEAEAAGPALERGARVEDALEFTARGVANLVSVFDPEMVVLGGGVMRGHPEWCGEVRRRAARWAQPVSFPRVRFETTALGEDAGLLGAARLALLGAGLAKDNEGIYVG